MRRKDSPSSRIPTTSSRERPQSIDIEDEFKNKLQYGRLIASLQQQQESPTANNKQNGANDVTSPSKIPVRDSNKRRPSACGDSNRGFSPSKSSHSSNSSRDSSPYKARNGNNDSCDAWEENERLLPSEDKSPTRSKIPLPKSSLTSSPNKAQPTVGWSLAPERQEAKAAAIAADAAAGDKNLPFSPLKEQKNGSSNCSSGNSSSSNSPCHGHRSSSSSSDSSTSTSKTQKSASSNGGDTDSATEKLIQDKHSKRRSRKKNYEAFMMTGDRMISLAKTPANVDFVAKSLVGFKPVPYPDEGESSLVPMSPAKDAPMMRDPPVLHRQYVRTSRSEDQLVHDSVISSDDLDDACGSVNTLLDTSADKPGRENSVKKHQRKTSFKRQPSAESSPGSRRLQQSPDFSTSSLISSEHYNGESLLDQDNLSPQTSSSPETPEWSLIDSFHKQKGSEAKAPLLPIASEEENLSLTADEDDETESQDLAEEAIKSEGNRVIITIGGGNTIAINSSSSYMQHQEQNDFDSSSIPVKIPNHSASVNEAFTNFSGPAPVGNYPSLNSESSEESDLESLRSYHPPARVIDIPSAERLAKRLFHLDAFKRTDVSRHLGKNNEFSQVVAEEYLRYFDFSGGMSLDMALRAFLLQFCLTGETQERERVLLHFSRRYLECNPDYIESPAKKLFRSLDAVHTLTCAIMLLNTDLHGDNVGLPRKMTCNEFIENLSDLNDGQNFPRDLLRSIYYAVKETPIPWAAGDEPEEALVGTVHPLAAASSGPVNKVVSSLSDTSTVLLNTYEHQTNHHDLATPTTDDLSNPANVAIGKTGGGINPFLALPDPATAVDYKKGYVMRKCCVDPNGKKTKLGKRAWRMFFVSLRDMVLYCFKDEKSVRIPGAFEDLSAAVRIHHGLAVRASDYLKKQFVFRLHTSDMAEYLFQTSDEKELLTWIDAINYVVASFSAPQLPAPCSSAGRFQRPLMPSSKTSLNMEQQLNSHESQLLQLRREIEDHLRSPPPKNAKATVWQSYKEKQEFLKFEIMRYETYILTLRTKNAHDK
jgi:hypothetical protein